MNGFRALYRKELGSIFYSPVAYAIIAVFTLLMAYTFCAQLFHTRSASLVTMLYQAATLLLLTVPLVTMRQFAEERSNGTLELLLSTPVGDTTIVFAKFAASMTMLGIMLAVIVLFPAALSVLASPDWGPVVSGYLGLLLMAGALTALGLAVSTLTSNQVIAAIVSLGLFLVFWMAEVLGIYLPAPLDDIAIALSLDGRLTPFALGLVYLSDVGYFLSLCMFGLWIAVAMLARR